MGKSSKPEDKNLGVKKPADDKAQKRLDQSNMVTQLKSDKASGDQKLILEHYKSLDIRDPLKQEILSKWKMDKSCRWANSFIQTVFKGTTNISESVNDYGSQFST